MLPRDLPRDFYAITELAAFTGDTCAINLATTRRNEKNRALLQRRKVSFPQIWRENETAGCYELENNKERNVPKRVANARPRQTVN